MSWSRKYCRVLVLLGAAGVLQGCNSFGGGDLGSVYRLANQFMFSGSEVTLQQAAAVPYASVGVKLGDSTEGMLILASDDSGQQLWTSASRVVLLTRNGKIVQTMGLPENLGAMRLRQGNADWTRQSTSEWEVDIPDLHLVSVPITCHSQYVRDEVIQLFGKDIHTKRISEKCRSTSDQLDWSFENTYWRDPNSNLAWRSIQHVHPKLDAVVVRVLRPPG